MIDISVSRDKNDIKLVDTASPALSGGERQKRGLWVHGGVLF